MNNTHRGNSQVKSNKTNILVHDYEMFEMAHDESIGSVFKRFNLIVTSLKGLGRTYENKTMLDRYRVLFLRGGCHAKVTSLDDSRDFTR